MQVDLAEISSSPAQFATPRLSLIYVCCGQMMKCAQDASEKRNTQPQTQQYVVMNSIHFKGPLEKVILTPEVLGCSLY